MPGYLTTHVLDTARGCPAEGIKITLLRCADQVRHQVAERITNADGRTDTPILPENDFVTGAYELIFHVGPYLVRHGLAEGEPMFLSDIPIRFGLAEQSHYHVPLLLSPFGYSTYRGS